jgi:type IV pilus assembly protein PilV
MKISNQMKTQMQSQSGFTFIEVMIAITLFSVGILGLMTTTHTVSLNQRNADDLTEATLIASDRMEEIKRAATNEPVGGSFGFAYFVNDQTGGFLNGYSAPADFRRTLAETLTGGYTRTTTVTVFPPTAWATEDFTTPDNIHMVEVQVDVSWANASGATKNILLNTVLQRRQFIQ